MQPGDYRRAALQSLLQGWGRQVCLLLSTSQGECWALYSSAVTQLTSSTATRHALVGKSTQEGSAPAACCAFFCDHDLPSNFCHLWKPGKAMCHTDISSWILLLAAFFPGGGGRSTRPYTKINNDLIGISSKRPKPEAMWIWFLNMSSQERWGCWPLKKCHHGTEGWKPQSKQLAYTKAEQWKPNAPLENWGLGGNCLYEWMKQVWHS